MATPIILSVNIVSARRWLVLAGVVGRAAHGGIGRADGVDEQHA